MIMLIVVIVVVVGFFFFHSFNCLNQNCYDNDMNKCSSNAPNHSIIHVHEVQSAVYVQLIKAVILRNLGKMELFICLLLFLKKANCNIVSPPQPAD